MSSKSATIRTSPLYQLSIYLTVFFSIALAYHFILSYKTQHELQIYKHMSQKIIESKISPNKKTYSQSGTYTTATSATSNFDHPENVLEKNDSGRISNCDTKLSDKFSRRLKINPVYRSYPQILQNYAVWHAKARNCLQSPTCFPKPKSFVLHCHTGLSCGGLGDRLRGIHFIFLLSILTNRLFFIDVPKGEHSLFDFDVGLHPRSVYWKLPSLVHSKNISKGTLNWSFKKDFLRLPLQPFVKQGKYFNLSRDAFMQLNEVSIPSLLYISSNIPHGDIMKLKYNNNYIKSPEFSYISTLKFEALLRMLTHMLFQPSPAVQSLMEHYKPMSNVVQGKEHIIIGLHVRTGEDVQEQFRSRFSKMKNNYPAIFASVMSRIQSKRESLGIENVNLVVASDSLSFKQLFKKEAEKLKFIDSIQMIEEKALHISKKVRTDPNASQNENLQFSSKQQQCRSFLNIFVDLFLLARAHILITTGSGFSKAAYFLGNSSELLIVQQQSL